MNITKSHWALGSTGLVCIALVIFVLVQYAKSPESVGGTISEVVATSTPVSTNHLATSTVAVVKKVQPFPINVADHIVSWDFKGAYSGNEILIAQANTDIAHLTALIGKGEYDDYDLYSGIANDEGALGHGKVAYDYYNRSMQIHPNKGLAYVNLAHLMEELGAYHTAADAYAKAVAVEPAVPQYRNAQIDFLMVRFPDEAARLKAKQ